MGTAPGPGHGGFCTITGGASPTSGDGLGVGVGGGVCVGCVVGAGVAEGLAFGLATPVWNTAATAGEGRETTDRGCSALETADAASRRTEAVRTQQTPCRFHLNLRISAL